MKTLGEKLKALSPRRRAKIETRAAALIAEEMSLRELRHAHQLTQKKMAAVLGVGQEGVSRLEQRSDLLLSTLRGYVEALGGHLELVATFPDRPPVVLSGLGDMETEGTPIAKSSACSARRGRRTAAHNSKRSKRHEVPA